jgi:putative transcriptional regulator
MVRIYLSALMGAKRINQIQLSRMTGIRYNTINDLYHELATSIKLEHIDLICEVLECTSAQLIEYIPSRKP